MKKPKKSRKLTDKYLKQLKPEDRAYERRDTETRGLVIRVQPSGLRTFYLQYRVGEGKNAKTCRLKIAHYPEVGLPMARKLAAQHLANITKGENPAQERRESRQAVTVLTLRQFIEGPYKDWAETNLKSHKQTMTRLLFGFDALLDRELSDLCAFDFEKNRQARLKTTPKGRKKAPKPATVNRDQAHMRAALSRAVKWGHVDANPIAGVTKAREDGNAKIRALTKEEEVVILDEFKSRRDDLIARITEQAHDGKRNAPNVPRFLDFLEPMFLLSLDTGIRRGEAFGLRWSDIDLKGLTLTVRGEGAKSSQSRVIPLSGRAMGVLKEWGKQEGKTGSVFPGANQNTLKYAWAGLLTDTEIVGLRWHDLRHTFGSRCAMAGVPVTVIQRLMGHSSVVTTQRYMHATGEDARRGIELLEQATTATTPANVVPMQAQK